MTIRHSYDHCAKCIGVTQSILHCTHWLTINLCFCALLIILWLKSHRCNNGITILSLPNSPNFQNSLMGNYILIQRSKNFMCLTPKKRVWCNCTKFGAARMLVTPNQIAPFQLDYVMCTFKYIW